MLIDVHKLIKEMIDPIQEQDIHIHVGGQSNTPTGSQTPNSGQDSNDTNTNTQNTNPQAQVLKKQLQSNQTNQNTQQSVGNSVQSTQGPTTGLTSTHPVQHQNNIRHVGQMMKNTSGVQRSPVKITKPKFNESTKREMKEIYVKDHIRRIGRRPTSQDVERKFNTI